MGANPVQVEVGEFDEAIEIVEDVVEEVAAESKFTKTHKGTCDNTAVTHFCSQKVCLYLTITTACLMLFQILSSEPKMKIQSLSFHLSEVLLATKYFWSSTASQHSPEQLKELGTCFESKKKKDTLILCSQVGWTDKHEST